MTLLYAAFAVVALWLLGELLLQRRAPLHWRALALLGFLVLVAGVAQRTLPLIGAGVLAFGAGQALATRAVKHSAGASYWSLVAPERVPVLGRLFGGEARPEPELEPELEREAEFEPPVEPVPVSVPEPDAVEATAVFQTDEYAVEGDSVYYAQNDYGYTQNAYPQQDYPQHEYPQNEYAQNEYAQAGYYAEADPYAQPYQEQYQQQYQEYAQYQQYPQYTEQQQYASYEQQAYPPQAPYEPQQYAQPQTGYDYEQAGYYTPDPQHHAPQG
ncbi:hypothetical protein [Streptacidiphilus pinicola]|uniref:hypothetical protein n=1 Tax=Streptacidiphilus pinicola TaxID=2219663 RepID=UPI001057CE0B|nr:hypothetical protein [Streptacidiphilus pinicola]